jgi:hypothetical protein
MTTGIVLIRDMIGEDIIMESVPKGEGNMCGTLVQR